MKDKFDDTDPLVYVTLFSLGMLIGCLIFIPLFGEDLGTIKIIFP